jgi:hypothetical protein
MSRGPPSLLFSTDLPEVQTEFAGGVTLRNTVTKEFFWKKTNLE